MADGAPDRRRKRPEPEVIFDRFRRRGHSPEAALSLTLSAFGLSQNLVEKESDGSVKRVLYANWTLEELNQLSWFREAWKHGTVGGSDG